MPDPNPLWELIQSYMDDPKHRYPPRPADLARETNVSDQVISKWKAKPVLPTAEQLLKFAAGTGIDYLDLLEAALVGRGYLPTEGEIKLKAKRFDGTLTFRQPSDGGDGNADATPGGSASTRAGYDLVADADDHMDAEAEADPHA